MTDNKSIPGLNNPQTYGMPAGNPRDSSIASMNSNNQTAANAAKLLSGGRLKRRLRGGADIPVGTFQMPYNTVGPGGPNAQIQANAQTSTQMAAWSDSDGHATQVNGGSRKRKGGNPDWVWGCMSGGIRHSSRKIKSRSSRKIKSRKLKRNKKSKPLNRSKKTRKY